MFNIISDNDMIGVLDIKGDSEIDYIYNIDEYVFLVIVVVVRLLMNRGNYFLIVSFVV